MLSPCCAASPSIRHTARSVWGTALSWQHGSCTELNSSQYGETACLAHLPAAKPNTHGEGCSSYHAPALVSIVVCSLEETCLQFSPLLHQGQQCVGRMSCRQVCGHLLTARMSTSTCKINDNTRNKNPFGKQIDEGTAAALQHS